MFDKGVLRDELQALKNDMSRLAGAAGEGFLDASRSRADALASQIKTMLDELGETLAQEESELEKLIANRPIASLASAFALGVVIGFLLKRN
jgi:ElaB/YqjD/DUF883 family membrane-anchored ribosome-binding protein